ncbi:FUSC family protein [Trinickia fusca]|uniref:FUSC family protein n=1 Tax=Trinickia fusca TaxID=2419777 RepID=A0A494X3F1_9BURK|nr:FUSC family protein [Trinickia fusca]RKP44141.1 FUSC family protein [Trinickia fusca]
MTRAAAVCFLRNAFDVSSLLRALAVCTAPVVLYGLTRDTDWLLATLMTTSLLIGIEQVGLAPLGVLAQAAAIGTGFLLLSFAKSAPPAFVAGCAALAAVAVALSLAGTRLRSLGNFVFIPSLYLACETGDAHVGVWQLIPYLGAAALPPLALSCAGIPLARPAPQRVRALMSWRLPRDLGPCASRSDATTAIAAVTLAVASAAALVEWRALAQGQWVIWSAASVVTGNAAMAGSKLRDRGLGAFIGVAIGLVLGLLLPHGTLVYALLALVSTLTLVAFRQYLPGFAARCACIACASWLAHQSAIVATERVVNVLLGGLIGVAFVVATNWIAKYRVGENN